MPATLAIVMFAVSALALVMVVLWCPSLRATGALQAFGLVALVIVAALVSRTEATVVLLLASSAFLVIGLRQRRLTPAAFIMAWPVAAIVVLSYGPAWVLAMALLLGWAQFAGSVSTTLDARDPERVKTRDATDLVPLAVVVLVGAVIVQGDVAIAGLVVFSALSFIANDVLASELGGALPGGAWLLPRLAAVPHGTPGAISGAGTAIGAVGSLCTGLCAGAILHESGAVFAVTIAGVAAGLLDSAMCRTALASSLPRGHEVINSLSCLAAIGIGIAMGVT